MASRARFSNFLISPQDLKHSLACTLIWSLNSCLLFCHLIAVLGEPCTSSSTGTCRCQQQQKAAGEDRYQAAADETAVCPGIGRAQLLRDSSLSLIDPNLFTGIFDRFLVGFCCKFSLSISFAHTHMHPSIHMFLCLFTASDCWTINEYCEIDWRLQPDVLFQ